MRIAKPLLLTTTPIGVLWGVVEAYRFHPWLAMLMVLLLGIISASILQVVRVIRREHATTHTHSQTNH